MNEQIEKSKKFFIGLDIGTESVGFAATDENYNVFQKHGKPCMGVRLFEEAQTAAQRRVLRANKVRQERGKFRIWLLQNELFNDKIKQVDKLFFLRLEASSFWADDKPKHNAGLTSLNSLFDDEKYADKSYFKEFKTIYHLRRFLMNEQNWIKNKPDIRLVYLACHHILKNRGHFIYEDNEMGVGDSGELKMFEVGKNCFVRLNEYLKQEIESSDSEQPCPLSFNIENFNTIADIAKNDKLKPRERQDSLQKELFKENFGKEDKKRAESIVKAVCGLSFKAADIFPNNDLVKDDEELKKSVTFQKDWDEELAPKFLSALEDDEFKLIEELKNIYDWFVLLRLLKGENCVSDAMIKKFDEHNRQLKELKKLVKENAKDKYYNIFRAAKQETKGKKPQSEEENDDGEEKPNQKKLCNYSAYVGATLSNGKSIVAKCSQDEFYEFLHNELEGILTLEIKTAIENHTYLPKLRTKDNATIPYQLHKAELEKILANAQKYGLIDAETAEKTLSVLEFRVPYYVGRTNPRYNKVYPKDTVRHAWIVKKLEHEKIRPWNFDKVVDLKKSGVEFITRMLSQCTYLRNEKVVPKHSLLYSQFMVLNELNNLKINGERLKSVLDKQRIFNELFKAQKRVTVKRLVEFLQQNMGLTELEAADITGIDGKKGEFNASLSSYIRAKEIFGEKIETKEIQDIVDDVILWHALHKNKKLVVSCIKDKYPELPEKTVNELKANLNFSGFGNFSHKFLTEKPLFVADRETGEVISAEASLMELLWDTNENLMEIISKQQYKFQEWLESENYKDQAEIGYEDIRKSYAAPSVKRAVWQAMLVVDELIELVGKKPNKIFIEVTRSNKNTKGEKGRTKSRKDQLLKLYAECKNINKVLIEQLEGELKNDKVTDNELRGEKLYLYFLQCGKCAYSGDPINIEDLIYDNKNSLYDVDHIIPQALKKDDSLNNKVLVLSRLNKLKDKNYPLNNTPEIWKNSAKLIPMWKSWAKCGLISEEKLERLQRTVSLGKEELEKFIARQLVFTGQSAIVTADLFKQKYKETKIVYSKAENVSDFRKKFDLLKCRELNDHHHAHDAYLNIVVGNTFHQRFNWGKHLWDKQFEQEKNKWRQYSQKHLFEYDVKDAWTAPLFKEQDKIKVLAERSGTLATIDKCLLLKYLPVSKRRQENKGALYKQTISPVATRQKEILDGRKRPEDLVADPKHIPRKGLKSLWSNTAQYGGYKTLTPAYFMIVEYIDKKGQAQREFTSVSLLNKKHWEQLSAEQKLAELSEKFGPTVKIIMPKVLLHSLFEIGSMQCYLSGWNGNQIRFHNAKQWFTDKESSDYIRKIAKYKDKIHDKIKSKEIIVSESEIKIAGKEDGKQVVYRLTKQENQRLWNVIVDKVRKLYNIKMQDLCRKNLGLPDIYDKLESKADVFAALSVQKQVNALIGLITGLGCNKEAFDLSELNGVKSACEIQPSVKIKYPLILVNQSVTGLKENRNQIYPFESENKN